MIRNGDLMRISAEIFNDLLRTEERLFGIDHPVFLKQLIKKGLGYNNAFCFAFFAKQVDKLGPEYQSGIGQAQTIQCIRQGKDQVEVLDRQKLLLLFFDPLQSLSALTFGTVAVAAGIVRNTEMTATIALINMSTKSGGTTNAQGIEHTQLMGVKAGIVLIVERAFAKSA